jgi:hypothetical protein
MEPLAAELNDFNAILEMLKLYLLPIIILGLFLIAKKIKRKVYPNQDY